MLVWTMHIKKQLIKSAIASMAFQKLSPILALLLTIFSAATEAQIYKYQKPNGKMLFTDTEIFIPGFILLNRDEVGYETSSKTVNPISPAKFQTYIHQASKKFGVEASLIKAIIKAESDFDPDARSKAGAEGLMQLMPLTAKIYNVQNSYNSKQNIMAGTEHIKYLMGKYKNNLSFALAAYNAGETAVNKHGGIPPYPETQRYVEKVFKFKKEFDKENSH